MIRIKTFEANELDGKWSIEDYCNGWLRANLNFEVIRTNLTFTFNTRLEMREYILTVVYKEKKEDGNKE